MNGDGDPFTDFGRKHGFDTNKETKPPEKLTGRLKVFKLAAEDQRKAGRLAEIDDVNLAVADMRFVSVASVLGLSLRSKR